MSSRSYGYSTFEDVVLCQVYIEISQDPIVGVQQTADNFWSRVEDQYNQSKDKESEVRSKRSLQSRWQTIEKAVRKLVGCIRQVENTNPSGASDQDILNRAKFLFMQDGNYKKGFKFDHIWNIVKDFPKFQDDVQTARQVFRKRTSTNMSSESDNPTPEYNASESPNFSDFNINLSDDAIGGSSSERPIGVKKAKLKRKMEEKSARLFSDLNEKNQQLLNYLEKSNEDIHEALDIERQKLEMQKRKMEFKEYREDNKILRMDLNQIDDPELRAFIANQKRQIMHKRSQSNVFNNYFSNIGGDGSDLPPY